MYVISQVSLLCNKKEWGVGLLYQVCNRQWLPTSPTISTAGSERSTWTPGRRKMELHSDNHELFCGKGGGKNGSDHFDNKLIRTLEGEKQADVRFLVKSSRQPNRQLARVPHRTAFNLYNEYKQTSSLFDYSLNHTRVHVCVYQCDCVRVFFKHRWLW